MINPRDWVSHASDMWELAFSQRSRCKRYTKDNFPDLRLTLRSETLPWLRESSFDTSYIIDTAFDLSELYPDIVIDLEWTDDGVTYLSFLNGSIKAP